MDEILVSILCMTYNHEHYIADALEGFIRQKTNFKIEVIVHDDASTDHTAEIITKYAEKYPGLIKTIMQKENQYSKHVKIRVTYMYPEVLGKYIALCEGDDYWTDSNKLQKQVDFMVAHPDCTMCYHAAEIVNVQTNQCIGLIRPYKKTFILPSDKLFFGGGDDVPTASILFLSKFVKTSPQFVMECPVGDHPLALIMSFHGRIGYIDEVMSVRNLWVENSWNTKFNQQGDANRRMNHIRAIIRLLYDYDKYSEYKYTKQIKQRILAGELEILQIQGKDPCFDDKILDLANSFSRFGCYRIYANYKIPKICHLFRKIRKMIISIF